MRSVEDIVFKQANLFYLCNIFVETFFIAEQGGKRQLQYTRYNIEICNTIVALTVVVRSWYLFEIINIVLFLQAPQKRKSRSSAMLLVDIVKL